MLTKLAVHGYRSLRDVVLPLGALTVITGANGTGKTSLYRAFVLLAEVARGCLVPSLAAAGGLPSLLWAGPEQISGAMRRGEVPVEGTAGRRRPVSLMLGFASDELGYLIDVGLPPLAPPSPDQPYGTLFFRDPAIKRELIFAGGEPRPAATLVDRRYSKVAGSPGVRLADGDSLLDELAAPDAHPEVAAVRRQVLGWRFYDSFRVDAAAPPRLPTIGTRTNALASDGSDLASAVQTIRESAWLEPFDGAIAAAFDGAAVHVEEALGRFTLVMTQPGMLRGLEASEWSDGTLRFVLLAAALLSPRPPGLLVLNEPEASLHPDVLPALARLIAEAAERTQVVVVTHSAPLIAALADADPVEHELVKRLGETTVAGQGLLTRPAWSWGSRASLS